jgi:alkylated DNA repair dioxygenase AlkB
VSVPAPTGSCFGWRPDGCVRVCSFDGAPGLYLLPQAISVAHQKELAVHAYTTLACPQYDCNLHSSLRLPGNRSLFQHWCDALRAPGSQHDDSKAAASAPDGLVPPAARAAPLDSLPRDAPGIERVLRKMRWIALGYRYDWSSLSYDWGQQPQPLPACTTRFADDTVSLLRQQPVGLQCGVYKPQAAVVNFYQIGDSLTSHVDRSEPAAGAPLVMVFASLPMPTFFTRLRLNCPSLQVSLSLGCPAVFVFGGETRDDDTLALLLRSGDVLVMVCLLHQ